MENIFTQIDKIFEEDSNEPPKWAKEILLELKEIKKILNCQDIAPYIEKNKNSTDIKSFIRGFRNMLKSDEKFIYQAREIGVNQNGLLYDINNNKVLNKFDAYEVYGYIFKHNIVITKIENSA